MCIIPIELLPPEIQTKLRSSFQIFKFWRRLDLNLWTRMSKKHSLQTLSSLFVKLGGLTLHLKHFNWDTAYWDDFATTDGDDLDSSIQSQGFS